MEIDSILEIILESYIMSSSKLYLEKLPSPLSFLSSRKGWLFIWRSIRSWKLFSNLVYYIMSSSKLYFEKLSLFLFLKVLSPRRSVVADIYLYGDRFDLGNYSRILYFILCRVKNSTSRNCPPLFLFYPRGRGDYLYGDRFDLGNSKTLPREIGVFLPSFFFVLERRVSWLFIWRSIRSWKLFSNHFILHSVELETLSWEIVSLLSSFFLKILSSRKGWLFVWRSIWSWKF